MMMRKLERPDPVVDVYVFRRGVGLVERWRAVRIGSSVFMIPGSYHEARQ
jgi:hypothetical protein